MTFSAGKAQFKEDMLQHLIGAFQCLEDLPEKKSHRNNHIVAYTIEHKKCSTILHQKKTYLKLKFHIQKQTPYTTNLGSPHSQLLNH
jgi:hypothetical protein